MAEQDTSQPGAEAQQPRQYARLSFAMFGVEQEQMAYPEPVTWWLCPTCLAPTPDRERHDAWHAWLAGQVAMAALGF